MSFRIATIWAYTIVGDDNEEGIVAEWSPTGWVPMIGADEARLRSLEPAAQQIANQFNQPLKLSKFSVREDVKDISPSPWRQQPWPEKKD